jgi:hypothetical protein
MEYLAMIHEVSDDEQVWVTVVCPRFRFDAQVRYVFSEHDTLLIEPNAEYPLEFWKHWSGFAVTIVGALDLSSGLHVERVHAFN